MKKKLISTASVEVRGSVSGGSKNIVLQRMARRTVTGLAALFIVPLLHAASITVVPTVTPHGGLFSYNYTITDNLPADQDAFLIDIRVPAKPGSILNLSAPSGFQAAFDSGLGLVSFIEDSKFFGSSPISGFSFDSSGAPGASTFEATILLISEGSLITLDGNTVAPGQTTAAAAPEPTTLLLTASCVPLFLLLRRGSKEKGNRT